MVGFLQIDANLHDVQLCDSVQRQDLRRDPWGHGVIMGRLGVFAERHFI